MRRSAKASGKPRNMKKSLKELVRYVKPQGALIITAMIMAVGSATLGLIAPTFASNVTDEIEAGIAGSIDMNALMDGIIIMICLYAGQIALMWLQSFIMTTVTQSLTKRMRRDISCKVNRLPLGYFDRTPLGDIMSRVTNDVDTVGQSLNQAVITLVLATVMLIGSTVMMFVTSPILAASAIASTVVGFLLMALIMTKSQKYFAAQQRSLGKVNGHIEEIFSGQLVVKAFGAEDNSKKNFRKLNGKLFESAWKSQFYSSIMGPLMSFIGNLGYVTVMVVGGVLVLTKGMSIGVITAFTLYIRQFSQPLTQLAQVMTQLQPAAAASERVFEFLHADELAPEKDGAAEKAENVNGEVVFDHIKFGYTPERTIINDFSATVKAGQKVAIVGPTGAGKTTLVNLLMRFYELDSGSISIDGVPLADMTRSAVHDVFGMVLQDTWLFKGTVRENIAYSKDVSDETILEACKKAGLGHYVATLPDGLDTVLSDAASVSAGQKQLMTIARAMVENAPVLILDEATSSVDTRTELLIQKAIDELTSGRTSFVIAHRLSTIKNADLILVMNKGDIVESGTHEQLLEKKGFYSELYNSQFASSGA